MPVSDLANVTRTLQTLLVENLSRIAGLTVIVTPQPPEDVEAVMNTLSLHLYHVSEDGYYKNCPGPGNDVPSVATSAVLAFTSGPSGRCLHDTSLVQRVQSDDARPRAHRRLVFRVPRDRDACSEGS